MDKPICPIHNIHMVHRVTRDSNVFIWVCIECEVEATDNWDQLLTEDELERIEYGESINNHSIEK